MERIEGLIADLSAYPDCVLLGSGAIVLTGDGRLLLQRRTLDAPLAPGLLNGFGGNREGDESAFETLRRELAEELGAEVDEADAVLLGYVQYHSQDPTCVAAVYFWHDKAGSITGCYEGTAEYFSGIAGPLADPSLHFPTRWGLAECLRRGLIPS